VNTFIEYISNIRISFADFIDILLLSILLYYVFRFIRDRRAGKLAIGVVFLIILQFIGDIFDLVAVKFIMQNVFQVGIIAIIILFQQELRSLLENVGGESLKGLKSIGQQKDRQIIMNMINELCEALFDMSQTNTGALVVIERSTKLGDVIKEGTITDAVMSASLLKNIFTNKSPLHDGAVIIRNFRIYSAGCQLPLSTNIKSGKELGMRHRAALGMSETSDAVVLVVSEENGVISLAIDGQLRRNYDYETIRSELDEIFLTNTTKAKMKLFSRKGGVESDEKK